MCFSHVDVTNKYVVQLIINNNDLCLVENVDGPINKDIKTDQQTELFGSLSFQTL